MAAIHSSTNSNSHHGRVHGAKTGDSNESLVQNNQDNHVESGTSPGTCASLDFLVQNHFSLFLLFPISDSAKLWCDENLPADRMTFGHGIVIEARYFWPILEALQDQATL